MKTLLLLSYLRGDEKVHKQIKRILSIVIIAGLLAGMAACKSSDTESGKRFAGAGQAISSEEIPVYSGKPYVELANNEPDFSGDDLQEEAYEFYSELDEDGKCGVAEANIGEELMPEEERGPIGQVKPTGWHTVKYDNIDGKYLYNRCHLIGYQLTGENANERNLITGTRYMNTEGMLPFEDLVAEYIRETGNHVLYRVTPIFEEDNLLASGVQMEAQSVEDSGEGVCFNVYVYNVQPGIEIDYRTGESRFVGDDSKEEVSGEERDYVLNTNSRKYHLPTCSGAKRTKKENREEYTGTAASLRAKGYEPCQTCNP